MLGLKSESEIIYSVYSQWSDIQLHIHTYLMLRYCSTKLIHVSKKGPKEVCELYIFFPGHVLMEESQVRWINSLDHSDTIWLHRNWSTLVHAGNTLDANWRHEAIRWAHNHWNGNIFILTKFPSLAALEVVKMTTSSAASDENLIKMTFSFQCCIRATNPVLPSEDNCTRIV